MLVVMIVIVRKIGTRCKISLRLKTLLIKTFLVFRGIFYYYEWKLS